ncbi:MAG: acetyl-CoA C-acyltransferase [Rickettsiaceae bacterium]|nr:MAG: acetyl-CoA C-acyltransferase [Rickettsiaceae bacterium]
MGSLSAISAVRLGAHVIKNIVDESRIDPKIVDEVILGHVITGGLGQNPARQALIEAGLSVTVPGYVVSEVCGSGLKAINLAAASIMTGASEIIIVGGQENMSLGMHASYIRAGTKFGENKMIDLTQQDGLKDAFSNAAMGLTAENIVELFGISRDQQDEFALNSHLKAHRATVAGMFEQEIAPIETKVKKDAIIFKHDETIRSTSTIELLAKLPAVFKQNGSVTAGNSSPISDGSAAMLLASEQAMFENNLIPLVRIVSFANTGVEPNIMGIGPISAASKALSLAGWKVEDLDLIEVNEAFAAASIYVNQQMKWDINKVNVCGGAIALGHPIGASGARILVTLIHQMKKTNAKKGLATMCIGGGMGIAICIENV